MYVVFQIDQLAVHDQSIREPARLGALASICTAPTPGFRAEALTTVGDAESAVDKDLILDSGIDIKVRHVVATAMSHVGDVIVNSRRLRVGEREAGGLNAAGDCFDLLDRKLPT